MRPIRLIVAACGVAAAALLAPMAAAAPSAPSTTVSHAQQAQTSTAVTAGKVTRSALAPSDACPWQDQYFGPVGTVNCKSWVAQTIWPDGRREDFVLGTDGKVYHEWQLSPSDSQGSGWYILGSSNNVQDGVYWAAASTTAAPIVRVQGGDSFWYCDAWNGSAWTNWYRC